MDVSDAKNLKALGVETAQLNALLARSMRETEGIA
jgi:hypothetical protein